jgi:uncharacterized lipoprotein YehR (DUF1307 family)
VTFCISLRTNIGFSIISWNLKGLEIMKKILFALIGLSIMVVSCGKKEESATTTTETKTETTTTTAAGDSVKTGN